MEVLARKNGVYIPVVVDDEDAGLLLDMLMSVGSHGYVQFWSGHTVSLLHRWLLGLSVGDGLIGDHINGNKLDNRRGNLRVVNPSGSSQNVSGRGRSPHRGVHRARSGRWVARVKFQNQVYFLGTFDFEEVAAAAADAKRRELMPFYVGRR